MNNKTLIAFFDGSCEPINPGGDIGTGVVFYEATNLQIKNKNTREIKSIYTEIKKITEISQFFPAGHPGLPSLTTNNVAEHMALNSAFEYIEKNLFHYDKIVFFGDSQFVLNQMTFKYKINEGKPYTDYAKINKYYSYKFKEAGIKMEFIWIPRELNYKADYCSKSTAGCP